MLENRSYPLRNNNYSKVRQYIVHITCAVLGGLVVVYGANDVVHRIRAYPLQSAVSKPVVTATSPIYLDSAPALVPARISVPAIGVNAEVEEVQKTKAGAMATPTKFSNVGWYTLGVSPGAAGNAVFDGHVNNALTRAGVFEHLSLVKVGDTVVVINAQAQRLVFVVTDIEDYTNDEAPLERIFAIDGPSGVVLITCAGEWDAHARSFNKRLVVYARLVSE